ncbi:nucleoside ABC transporter membrane protein [Geosporobacter subterraneus DSM 17957]|uniref:Nucleoside ABC transporter membrane protein n=1 Tax=Geosporobacter subterraneus DSM 17957 TaxID=1121919 RepID=A0A1M6MDD5_9FIRM|nr:ABC transporter permease [Geosporobacter subterraneus]SHJ81472.1 nucleoside ABC transporter membrane protein [Geosporobacter subterraneus DSM 17957]
MDSAMLIATLAAAVTAGTPIFYACLGELLTEKSGNLNLGVEGMMLIGAVCGFKAAVATGNPWIGFLTAMLAGAAISLIHGFLTIHLKASQVVSGLALTIFGTGLSSFIGKPLIGIPAPVKFNKIPIPGLSEIPYVGQIFFNHDALIYLSYVAVILVWVYLYKTNMGLKLKAVGENPAAADSLGVNVMRMQYIHVMLGGVFAGAGGAYLSLAYAPAWLENMTAGRGWIAVALVIFALWNPLRAMLGAYIFGGLDILGFRAQTFGIAISPFFMKMIPYLFTIAVLIFISAKNKRDVAPPAALGVSYSREER